MVSERRRESGCCGEGRGILDWLSVQDLQETNHNRIIQCTALPSTRSGAPPTHHSTPTEYMTCRRQASTTALPPQSLRLHVERNTINTTQQLH